MQDNLNSDELEPSIDHDAIERGMHEAMALKRRNGDLERACNDAVLALKSRDVEIETLRLALAERDNRIASVQAACDERIAAVQAERDALINEAAELRAIHAQIKMLYERIELPLPRLVPPEAKQARRKRNNNGDEPELMTGK